MVLTGSGPSRHHKYPQSKTIQEILVHVLAYAYGKCYKLPATLARQTVQTQIRLLLKKQSDQGLPSLLLLTRVM